MNIGWAFSIGAVLTLALVSKAEAQTCVGNCGTIGVDGVVGLPASGDTSFSFVSTYKGQAGAGHAGQLPNVDPNADQTNGSSFLTASFSAKANSQLTFYFDYITTDGGQYSDYAFGQLLDATNSNKVVATLFTAQTNGVGGTTSPAPVPPFPATGAALTPASVPISGGGQGPTWSPLGQSSGTCFAVGCGYTGWVKAQFAVPTTGTYDVLLGVSNFTDKAFDSGLAFDQLKLDGTVIDGGSVAAVPGPIPGAGLLSYLALGLLGFGSYGWKRLRSNAVTA